MDTLKQQVITLLKRVEATLWDGVVDKEDAYLPYTYICHSSRDEAKILEVADSMCYFEADEMARSIIRRNLDYMDAGTVSGACYGWGIFSDERIQAVRKKFVKAILHKLEVEDTAYPDNSILQNILQEFQ